jgi:hypothetical protein
VESGTLRDECLTPPRDSCADAFRIPNGSPTSSRRGVSRNEGAAVGCGAQGDHTPLCAVTSSLVSEVAARTAAGSCAVWRGRGRDLDPPLGGVPGQRDRHLDHAVARLRLDRFRIHTDGSAIDRENAPRRRSRRK